MASWSNLDLRHLIALRAVADAGSISKAADVLGYTQSAVSQQVAALEKAVGAPVFDRPGGPKPLVLTEAGEVLLGHARNVLEQLSMAEADVAAVVGGEKGTLRVGTVQSVGTRVLPDVLRGFHVERPGVQVVLRESHDPRVLLGLVAAGELDVTFCEVPMPDGPWLHREVLVDPFILLAPAGSAQASLPSVAPEDVVGLPLIGYRNDFCASNAGVVDMIGAEPNYVFRSDDNTTIQGCVGAGLGFAIIPRLTVDADDPAVRVVPFVPPAPPRTIAVAWSKDRREAPSLGAFVDCVLATCATIDQSLTSVA